MEVVDCLDPRVHHSHLSVFQTVDTVTIVAPYVEIARHQALGRRCLYADVRI